MVEEAQIQHLLSTKEPCTGALLVDVSLIQAGPAYGCTCYTYNRVLVEFVSKRIEAVLEGLKLPEKHESYRLLYCTE